MNSLFSFSRLGKLMAKQLFENSRFYTFTILAMIGLLSLVFAFWISVGGPAYYEQVIYIIFFMGIFISGSVFASMSFNMLGSKDKGIYWLGIPATHAEKLVCTIIFSTFLFTLAYCLCFFLVKTVSVAILHEYLKTHPGNYVELNDFTNGFGSKIKYIVYTYFALQSLYLLGSVYFSRYSFIVTTVVLALIVFAFGYYLNRINNSMFENTNWNLVDVRKRDSTLTDGYYFYTISPALSEILKYAFQFIWAPFFWVITWYRLKEKEI